MKTISGPEAPLPEDVTLADLVEAQVDRTPSAVAALQGGEQLTYAELDARANRLARALQSAGVGPEAPVALLLERSLALPVSLLAILKAGGACLPLDPAQPAARLGRMLAEAAPRVILSQERLAGRLGAAAGEVLLLDRDWNRIEAHEASRPARAAGADSLAYVIFTSGSTGEPKGVMLTHRGLVNHNLAVSRLYELSPADRVLQFCSIGFDVSIEEIFPTLETGATIVFRQDDAPVLGGSWLEWLRSTGVTVLNLPTAYWHEWVRDLHGRGGRVPDCVRLTIVGGERALGAAYREWTGVAGSVRWLNAYGPAECSVLATVYEPPADADPPQGDPPIGRPLANTTLYILADGEDGVGELLIGGAGVARGYLNRPDLTAVSFDTFADPPGSRTYRTGDLVRLLPDGNLAFAGRLDAQVKVRGFRIEPGEIESALARHPDVAESAVVGREDRPGDKRLVAYVVPRDASSLAPAALRGFLSEQLPSYMVPAAFVMLAALPLTPSGKLDRDALPMPERPRPGEFRSPAAATATERAIAAAFSRVLGIDEVGRDEDFFQLGGHSLQAVQVVAAIREQLGVPMGMQSLLEAPTVAGLAAAVAAAGSDPELPPPLVARPRRPAERIPLTLSQEHMWRLETAADPPGLFNVTAIHRFDRPVDLDAMRRAIEYLTARHEALRASVHSSHAGPYQTVAPPLALELEIREVDSHPELRESLAGQDAEPFSLESPPLWRVGLHRLDPDHSVLAATFDHLVCDGTSAYVFLSELNAAYEAIAAGAEPALRELPIQFPDFARWQRGWLTEERLEAQLDYWREKLAGMPLGPAVPFDHVPERPSRRIASVPVTIEPGLYQAMSRLARSTAGTVFVVTVAAMQALFARAGGRSDVVLSTTLSGRQRAEVDGLIGCFHGVGRIRTDLSGDPTFAEVLERTREAVVGLLEHQDIPFYRIRQAVLPDLPAGGPALLRAVPTELQYFHTAHEEWAPGAGVVERPGADPGPDQLFFRGHLHPLQVSFLDDGARLWGALSYKVDFYDAQTIDSLASALLSALPALTQAPELRLSQLA